MTYIQKSVGPFTCRDIILEEGAIATNLKANGGIHLDRFSCVSSCETGKYVGVGCFSYVARSVIGNYVSIGSRVSIGGFHHPTEWLATGAFQWGGSPWASINSTDLKKPQQKLINIGSDVWICDNVVLLQGVYIGNGSIVGAGSIVTNNVPPFTVVAGNPARVIRNRFEGELADEIDRSQWWNKADEKLIGIPWNMPERAVKKWLL